MKVKIYNTSFNKEIGLTQEFADMCSSKSEWIEAYDALRKNMPRKFASLFSSLDDMSKIVFWYAVAHELYKTRDAKFSVSINQTTLFDDIVQAFIRLRKEETVRQR